MPPILFVSKESRLKKTKNGTQLNKSLRRDKNKLKARKNEMK
jgi:hypothetical protein